MLSNRLRFDPIFLIPVIVILGAGALLVFWWRDFAVNPPLTTSVTPTTPPSDPAALARLKQMEAAMNQLTTLQTMEVQRDDSGNTLTTILHYAAPDRVTLVTDTGAHSIGIGPQQWARAANEPLFTTWTRPEPFVFPDFHYYSRQAVDVQLGTDSELNGEPVISVTFAFLEDEGRFDFAIYADPTSLLFRRLTMNGLNHHMTTDFLDYSPLVIITPPPREKVVPTATPTP